MRLAADRGWIQQQFRAGKRHAARRFRKPLIPANAGTDRAVLRFPDDEPGVARREIMLFLIAGAVRDMALAVVAEHGAIGIDHRQRIEKGIARALEIRHRNHRVQFRREFRKPDDRRVAGKRFRQREIFLILVFAEVRRLEQFLDEDHLRTLLRSGASQLFGAGNIGLDVPAAGELGGGDGHATHGEYLNLTDAAQSSRVGPTETCRPTGRRPSTQC